jgi:putative transposase
LSERHACRLVSQPRGTQRYQPTQRNDEDQLTQAIIVLASRYGRYDVRRITPLLQQSGWNVGKDRVQRIWRRAGLKVPAKQQPRGRLWLSDGSCIRLRPERANHVWSYDFVEARTHDGRSLRLPRSTVFLCLRDLHYGRTASGVQALTMNSLRSAWTPSSPASCISYAGEGRS